MEVILGIGAWAKCCWRNLILWARLCGFAPPLPAEVESVRLVPPLRPPEIAAADAVGPADEGVVGVAGVAVAVPVPEPVEAVDVFVGVVPALVAQLAVDKADTTVDCCPSGFLVAFK